MTYVVTDACIDALDRACAEECPVDCIYWGDRMVYINPDECVDCGKCVPACPNAAIFSEHKVPDDRSVFVEIGASFFETNPDASGGAEDAGQLGVDHPVVASWKR